LLEIEILEKCEIPRLFFRDPLYHSTFIYVIQSNNTEINVNAFNNDERYNWIPVDPFDAFNQYLSGNRLQMPLRLAYSLSIRARHYLKLS
jgi:hypothetical protein